MSGLRGKNRGKGGETLLKKRFPSLPPAPIPPLPKTFDWWGGRAAGVPPDEGDVRVLMETVLQLYEIQNGSFKNDWKGECLR